MRPLDNRQIEKALQYHDATKHSYWSVRSGSHLLDWENKPSLFKVYRGLPEIPLPREIHAPGAATLAAVSDPGTEAARRLDLDLLATLLFYAAGLTKQKTDLGGETYLFRAAACTGALYEIEVYAVCGDLPGLPAGVYHFSPAGFSLSCLRAGDLRGELVLASAAEASVARAPVTLVLTAIYWRNAWKYRARAYRHFYWNSGTILANLLATAASEGVACRVVLGFVDELVDRLLAIDPEREASLCLVPLGQNAPAPPPADVAPIALEVLPLSTHEVDYPLIRQIRASSMLRTDAEVRTWREGFAGSPAAPPMGRAHPLESVGESEAGLAPLAEVIVRRGSTRRFARTAIGFRQLSTILDRTTRGIPADFLAGPGTSLIDAYLIVNAVDGLPSGAYYYARPRRALELLRPGAFRREAGYLCLEQALGADASVVVFFLTDLARLLERYGNRGYGAAQLEAGIVGGKMYLAAYALGLGATGTTFYDDDVTAFFAPHARGKSVLFALALGRAAKAPGRVRLLQPGER